MNKIYAKRLTDEHGSVYVAIYDEGRLSKPIVLLQVQWAEELAKSIMAAVKSAVEEDGEPGRDTPHMEGPDDD